MQSQSGRFLTCRVLPGRFPPIVKHRASGQAVVTLGYRDFYLGPYSTKVRQYEYDRLVSEWLKQGRQLGRQFLGLANAHN